ncbi:MAG TPA: crosslink repair DNA glycosylase YcaQ family protein [Cyclobacteriaceae bacterium]|nr:crosslink repair DNA glycosylase YcaQ family protein [Cyclobacteriaceae bacterium]
MKPLTLTKAQARKIILDAAGLTRHARFGRGKEAVYKSIHHLGFVQVDTNYVVERAHHHSIAARVPGYKPEWLGELQSDGRIYEFWTRDSGFMPMNEFRFSLPIHDTFAARWKSLPQADINLMNKILNRIGREGPLGARDFENDRVTKSSGWWDWRPSKVALERLHLAGKLLATRKKDFHKIYDLTDNIIPAGVDRTRPTLEEYGRHVVLRSLKALGVAYGNEIAWNGRLVKDSVKPELKKLVDTGEVCEVNIEGLKGPLYMLPEYKNKKINLAGDAFILSPFDMLNVFRRRLRDFFDFEYQVECFVPEAKRKYGYFSLPILVGDTFVARMDSKADRKKKTLTIHNIHFEPVKMTKDMTDEVCDAIGAFAKFNECAAITITKSNNKALLKTLRETL